MFGLALSNKGYRVCVLRPFYDKYDRVVVGGVLVEGDANIRCVITQSSKPGKTFVTSRVPSGGEGTFLTGQRALG